MLLRLRETQGVGSRLRLGVVAALVLALLAFPCGPLATALETGHTLATAMAAPGHSEHGDAECSHRAKEHESSCCNSCSSWITSRLPDGPVAILTHSPQHDLPPAVPAYAVEYDKPDRDLRVTGPPELAPLDGTSLYMKTGRYRI